MSYKKPEATTTKTTATTTSGTATEPEQPKKNYDKENM